MGFGLDSIGNAFKGAVNTVTSAASSVAQKVESGAEQAQKAVADVVRSAVESVNGRDGFDEPVHGPVAESKPKGGGNRADTGSSGTAYA
jgi:phage-related protein